MLKPGIFLLAAVALSPLAQAQVFQRELGDFDLKLGTTPSRSMAQGLVKSSSSGSFHGGLDLGHDSGWYLGQWSPSLGLGETSALEVDSYLGFKRPFDQNLGYELGMVNYSAPQSTQPDSQQFYAGLSLLGSRFGAAFNNDPARRDSTLFADLGGNPPFGIGVSIKYTSHQLAEPVDLASGAISRFDDWSIKFSRPWMGIDLNLIYSDSSLAGSECSAYSGLNSRCDSLLTFRASRSLF